MEDLRIFYPIYDTKTKVDKSFVNPFEEFIHVAITKYYNDFENVSYTIGDFYNLPFGEIERLFSKHFGNVSFSQKDENTENGLKTFALSIDSKFIGVFELNKADFVVGDRGANHGIKFYYKDNHMFDYLVDRYEKSAFYAFNEIPRSYHSVRILLCMIKLFTHFGEYAKYRTFNAIKPNSIGPLLKKRLNISPDDDTTFIGINYGVSDAIVIYAPSKGKMDQNFESIKTKKISYNSYASDIDAFVKEVKNEN